MHEIRLPISRENLVSALAIERYGHRARPGQPRQRITRVLRERANRLVVDPSEPVQIVHELVRRRRGEMRRTAAELDDLPGVSLLIDRATWKNDAECLQRSNRAVRQMPNAPGDGA